MNSNDSSHSLGQNLQTEFLFYAEEIKFMFEKNVFPFGLALGIKMICGLVS
jgi:hypothetical protein